GTVHGGARRGWERYSSGAHAGLCRNGRDLPYPKLLCIDRRTGRRAWHRCKPAPSFEQDHPHQMTKPNRFAVAAATIFDGQSCRRDCAVVIEGAQILGLVPRRELAASVTVWQLPEGAWLAPGFIDCQVNGGGDVLFNDEPAIEAIAA